MSAEPADLRWTADYPAIAIHAVDRIVEDQPALRTLDLTAHLDVRRAAATIKGFLALRPRIPVADSLLREVDFPAFVADLIEGTFDAIVDASIQQMKAYGALLQEVAEAVDQFLLERDDRCLRQQQHAVADALLTGIYRITRAAPAATPVQRP